MVFKGELLEASKEELLRVVSSLQWNEQRDNTAIVTEKINTFFSFFNQQHRLFLTHFEAETEPTTNLEVSTPTVALASVPVPASEEKRSFSCLQEMVGKTFTFNQNVKNGELSNVSLPNNGNYVIKESVISVLQLQHGDRLFVKKFVETIEGTGNGYLEFEVAERIGLPSSWRKIVYMCHVESLDGKFHITGDEKNEFPSAFLPAPLLEKDVNDFNLTGGDIVRIAYNPESPNPQDSVRVLEKYDTSSPFFYTTPSSSPAKRKARIVEKERMNIWEQVDINLFLNLDIVVLGGESTSKIFDRAAVELEKYANCTLKFVNCDVKDGRFVQKAEGYIRNGADLIIINTIENNHPSSWEIKGIASKHGVSVYSHLKGGSEQLIYQLYQFLKKKESRTEQIAQ